MKKYLVVNASDAYSVSTGLYESEEAMLEYVQNYAIEDISVYEVVKKVRLVQRTAIILGEDNKHE